VVFLPLAAGAKAWRHLLLGLAGFVHGFEPIFLWKIQDPQLSYEKNPPTFHYTGWFLGIFILAY